MSKEMREKKKNKGKEENETEVGAMREEMGERLKQASVAKTGRE